MSKQETTKEQMTAYLEKFQQWQRLAQGTIDATVSMSHSDGHQVTAIHLHLYPFDEEGNMLMDRNGKYVCHTFSVFNWTTPDSNEHTIKQAVSTLKKYKVIS